MKDARDRAISGECGRLLGRERRPLELIGQQRQGLRKAT